MAGMRDGMRMTTGEWRVGMGIGPAALMVGGSIAFLT